MSSELLRKYSNIIKEGFAIARPSQEEEVPVEDEGEEIVLEKEPVDPKAKKQPAKVLKK